MAAKTPQKPILQVALDFLELNRALKCAREAVKGGADWIEVGTPLVKSAGLDSVRALRAEFPKHTIVADLKTMDAGRCEMEAAAKAGANVATVMGAASEASILECIEAGRNYGIDICVDLLEVTDPAALAKKCEEWGAHHVGIHIPIDAQMRGEAPFDLLRKVRAATNLPVAAAGGFHSESAPEAVRAGADIVIVGGAITKSMDAEKAARDIRHAIDTLEAVQTSLYKRKSAGAIREIFERVSTPNLSDAMHRGGVIYGIPCVTPGKRLCGPAFTVRTYPGDWAKPVESIDLAKPGDVLVIDAGGLPPAVWGELASESALQKKIAGVVIYGAIRDIEDIRKIGFTAFARHVTPNAGEPKGFGETGVNLKIEGMEVAPGDWIIGDDNGLVRVPSAKAVEVANRAMDVLERENRLRAEIRANSSLAEVAELVKWEKRIAEGT
ncbi:MAG: orotidine 5'-phosphate decarboxylase [Planctomycetes bacterium]|nr:orotidine 5'-phosphate decarboxylase [Planctomycetota bacterium]